MRQLFFLFLWMFLANSSVAQECDSIPSLNKAIVDLAKAKTGKKVDRGECWDLAYYVLSETNANWDGLYTFGSIVNPANECIYPGDIIQFERVRLKYTRNDLTIVESMEHHTAIVASVENSNELILIHQNTGEHGKKVGETAFNFKDVVRGKISVYRPTLMLE